MVQLDGCWCFVIVVAVVVAILPWLENDACGTAGKIVIESFTSSTHTLSHTCRAKIVYLTLLNEVKMNLVFRVLFFIYRMQFYNHLSLPLLFAMRLASLYDLFLCTYSSLSWRAYTIYSMKSSNLRAVKGKYENMTTHTHTHTKIEKEAEETVTESN